MSRAAAFLLVKIKDMNRVRGLLACAVLTLLFGWADKKLNYYKG